jgi:hypothetical protein
MIDERSGSLRIDHSRAYNEEVAKRLDEATSKEEALEILEDLKQELLTGRLKINKANRIHKK